MSQNKRSSFWIGFLLALTVGILVWYWQKSTSADEGALDLLDELAKAKGKIRELQLGGEKEMAVSQPGITLPPVKKAAKASAADDLTMINGIGPVYARRLQEAGITTFAALAAQDPERLGEIVKLREWQAGTPSEWIAQAAELSA